MSFTTNIWRNRHELAAYPRYFRFIHILWFSLGMDTQALWGLFICLLSQVATTLVLLCLLGLQFFTASLCPKKCVCMCVCFLHDIQRVDWPTCPLYTYSVYIHICTWHRYMPDMRMTSIQSSNNVSLSSQTLSINATGPSVSLLASLTAKPHSSSSCHFLHLLHWRGYALLQWGIYLAPLWWNITQRH